MLKRVLCAVLYIAIGVILLIINAYSVRLGMSQGIMITIVRVYAVIGVMLAVISAIFKKR